MKDITISIEKQIYTIRGIKVMLDSDLAALYGVPTKVFNQSIKRNQKRFPTDFMFRLTQEEWSVLRSQIVTSNKRGGRRYTPYAFTEHGVAMLSSILNTEKAIQINIQIMRAFITIRRYALAQRPENVNHRIGILEKALLQYMDKNDRRVNEIVETINDMLSAPAQEEEIKQIGFIKHPRKK